MEHFILYLSLAIIACFLLWFLISAITVLYGMILNFKDDTRGFFQVIKRRNKQKKN